MPICALHARPQSFLLDPVISQWPYRCLPPCHLRIFEPGKTSHELSTEGPDECNRCETLNRFSARSSNKDNNGRLSYWLSSLHGRRDHDNPTRDISCDPMTTALAFPFPFSLISAPRTMDKHMLTQLSVEIIFRHCLQCLEHDYPLNRA